MSPLHQARIRRIEPPARPTRPPCAPHSEKGDRRGVAIIIALVALTLASVFLLAAVQTGVREYRAVQSFERERQSDWLANSGLARAQARLSSDASYAGETWDLPAATFGTSRDGRVVITVAPDADHPGQRLVTAQADYPVEESLRSRTTRRITIELPEQGESP